MGVSDVQIPRKRELAMGSTMPFSTYNVEPSLMEAMRAAFYRVCDVLQLSCDREDPLTEIVVTKIVELAKAGERDPEILSFAVLAELEMPLQEAIPRSLPKPASVVSTEATAPSAVACASLCAGATDGFVAWSRANG
jgi:hypothetical protein